MSRIGTGLSSKIRCYVATTETAFHQLESVVRESSTVPAAGTVIVLSATLAVQTLDSSYVQGVVIRNPHPTVSVYVGGAEYAGTTVGVGVLPEATAWEIPAGSSQRFDCRDGSGIYIAAASGTVNVKVVAN